MRAVRRTNQLVELELEGVSIAILGVLNNEHHEKGEDRRAGVDDQLPGIAEPEDRARDGPNDDNKAQT